MATPRSSPSNGTIATPHASCPCRSPRTTRGPTWSRGCCTPITAKQLRLACALVLFAYLVTHFSNHALGLLSVRAADAGRRRFVALWRNPLGTLLLYAALLTHAGLGFAALYRRRTLRMPPTEAMQILFGLTIPLLLAGHVVGTRVANALFGRQDVYTAIAYNLWNTRPELGFKQSVALVIVWTHACIGLH